MGHHSPWIEIHGVRFKKDAVIGYYHYYKPANADLFQNKEVSRVEVRMIDGETIMISPTDTLHSPEILKLLDDALRHC